MTSRIPPSRRDPQHAEQRVTRALSARTPGTGRVTQAAPVLPDTVAAALRGRPTPSGGSGGLHVGPSAPTGPEVFWFDTDASCP